MADVIFKIAALKDVSIQYSFNIVLLWYISKYLARSKGLAVVINLWMVWFLAWLDAILQGNLI